MEEFKVGDQVTNPFRGIGIIVKPPHVCVRYDTEVRLDGGYLSTKFWEDVNSLTKIKPKVKRWRWVYGKSDSSDGDPLSPWATLTVSFDYYTEKEAKITFCNSNVLEKLSITEKEFDKQFLYGYSSS